MPRSRQTLPHSLRPRTLKCSHLAAVQSECQLFELGQDEAADFATEPADFATQSEDTESALNLEQLSLNVLARTWTAPRTSWWQRWPGSSSSTRTGTCQPSKPGRIPGGVPMIGRLSSMSNGSFTASCTGTVERPNQQRPAGSIWGNKVTQTPETSKMSYEGVAPLPNRYTRYQTVTVFSH